MLEIKLKLGKRIGQSIKTLLKIMKNINLKHFLIVTLKEVRRMENRKN